MSTFAQPSAAKGDRAASPKSGSGAPAGRATAISPEVVSPEWAAPTIAERSGPALTVWRMRAQASDGDEQPLRRAAESSGAGAAESAPKVVGEVLGSGGGQPLDARTRGYFEPLFGHDFGGVRVHDDARADASARSVNAAAYTVGQDVVFRGGTFAPDTTGGKRLLAHELTHVVQQSGGLSRSAAEGHDGRASYFAPRAKAERVPLKIGAIDDPHEREADRVADAVIAGRPSGGQLTFDGGRVLRGFRWPWEPVPPAADLLRDGVAGDTQAICDIQDFTVASESQRITMAGHLTGRVWVGSSSGAALVRLWSSFGEDFPRVAAANLQLWRNCCARNTSLADSIPASVTARQAFTRDVLADARSNLSINRRYALQVMQQLGMPIAPWEPWAALSEQQSGQLARLQVAAQGVAKLQYAQQVSRSVPVGYVRVLLPRDGMYYERQTFDPERPPGSPTLPAREMGESQYIRDGDDESDTWQDVNPWTGAGNDIDYEDFERRAGRIRSLTAVQPYAPVKAAYDQAQAAIAAMLAAFPELYLISMGGAQATSAFASAESPQAARAALGTAIGNLLENIARTEERLNSGDLDPLDLTPIHERMFASPTAGASGVIWSQPFPRSAGEDLARGRSIDLALRRLLLQSLAQIAFVLAPIAGPAAIPLLLAGTAATGANFALDFARYQALSDAAGSSARPGTELVSRRMADEARMTMEAEAIALVLAVIALGTTAGAAALARIRTVTQARALAALRARLIAETGAPTEVVTGGPLMPRPRELPYTVPPGTRVVRPGQPLDVSGLDPSVRYIWVVDTEGNILVTAESQPAGVFSQGRTVAKHGDLVPGAGGQSRGAARAGGELNAERLPDGSVRWNMNNDSSYTFQRMDGTVSTGRQLDAAHELLGTTGTDMTNIRAVNTSGGH